MAAVLKQLFPGKPNFAEANFSSQAGRVIVVTGGNAGLGYHLSKAEAAILKIKSEVKSSSGDVKYIHLDLADMTTIKPAAQAFAAQETKLNVLFNNAGIGFAPEGSKTKQGLDLMMGVNATSPLLLSQLLLPYLQSAAKTAPKDSVRVVWTSSPVVEDAFVLKGSLTLAHMENLPDNYVTKYNLSKATNWYLASELARRVKKDGIVREANNPGNLKTTLWDPQPRYIKMMMGVTMHPPVYGTYTNLWSGVSEHVTLEDGGRYAVPWKAWHPAPRQDLLDAMKKEEEGGTGHAAKVWDWFDVTTREYA